MPMHSRFGWRRYRIWDRLGQHPLSLGVTYGVSLSVDDATQDEIFGQDIAYTITVTNDGSAPDTFDIAKAGESWSTVLSGASIGPIAAGATDTFTVTVTIPYSADLGDTDEVAITVTSQADATKSDSAGLISEASFITDTPYAWFRADKITGLSDGDAVAQWDDLSGNARHVVQAVGGSKPAYKINIVNGYPVVRGDGGDVLILTNVDAPGNAFSMFGVALSTSFVAWQLLAAVNKSGTEMNGCIGITATAEAWTGFTTGPGVWVTKLSTDKFQAATFHYVAGYYDGSSVEMAQLDDTEETATPGGTPQASTNLQILGNSFQGAECWAGDCPEIIIFAAVPSSADRAKIKTYLEGKYDL